MRKNFCGVLLLILAGLPVPRLGAGLDTPYAFSPKAVERIADIAPRVRSPLLADRIAVLEELVVSVPGHPCAYTYAHDLSPEDYAAVVASVLDGGLLGMKDVRTLRDVFSRVTETTVQFERSELLPAIVGFLDHEDPVVQIQALMVLKRLGAGPYTSEVVKAASSPNPNVRRPALEILWESGSKEAVPVLVSCLKEDDFTTRREAIKALGRIGDRSAVPSLVPLLKTEMNSWAINALVRMDAREAAPHIKELYRPGQTNSNAVLTSLAYFGDEEAIAEIVAQLTDDERSRGNALLDTLVATKARAAIPALLSVLQHEAARNGRPDRGPNIVGYVMIALARLEAEEAVPVLRRYLHPTGPSRPGDLDDFFAGRAIEALGILRAREAVDELLLLLDSDESFLRRRAQVALARIGEPSTAERILASLKKYPPPYSASVEVLEKLANISDPGTYRTISTSVLPRFEPFPVEQYLEQLSEKSGVRFALSETIPMPEERRSKMVAGRASQTALFAVRDIVDALNYSGADYAVFISDGVVSVVTIDEAFALWDEWRTGHTRSGNPS